jgi:hypothetical protein
MTTTTPWRFAGVIVGSLIALSAPLRAQPADAPSAAGSDDMPWNRGIASERRAGARQLFLEGNRLFKIPLFAQAVEKYDEALDQWKHPAFYFNLAFAQLNLGQDFEARDSLERALQYGPEPLGPDRFKEAQNQLLEVQRHLGRIRITCPTPGAEITLDGVPLFTGPGDREVWVKAQAHEVTAKAPDYATQSRRLNAPAGARQTLDLSLRKLIEDRPWSTWKPWAVMASGAAVAAAGGVLHAFAARDFNDYDARFVKLPCASLGCTGPQIEMGDPRLPPLLRRAQQEQRIAVAAYVAGGAAVAAGVVLVYLNRPHLMDQEGASSRQAGVAMTPVVSADLLGVMVTVRH